jgi:hypothetical protein
MVEENCGWQVIAVHLFIIKSCISIYYNLHKADKVLVREPEGERPLGRPKST